MKICRALNCSLEYMLTGEMGLAEFLRCNQVIADLPELDTANLRKIAQAFWDTLPTLKK